jgi:hypothetical protein
VSPLLDVRRDARLVFYVRTGITSVQSLSHYPREKTNTCATIIEVEGTHHSLF